MPPFWTNDKLEDFFDPPFPAPVENGYLARLAPYVTGQTPPRLAGAPAFELVSLLIGEDRAKSAELVLFGCLWLFDRPFPDPLAPLPAGAPFRFNPPAYGPVKFYEADLGRAAFEDEDLLIYDKEAGRPCQPVPHDAFNNILAALKRALSQRDGAEKNLWISHRLDADTSGLIIFAKNKESASRIGRAFQQGQVDKIYLALARGANRPQDHFEARGYIAKEKGRYVVRGKPPGLAALTIFDSLYEKGEGQWLFSAKPVTGRTHQIRLHLSHLGWPILGDRFYGGDLSAPRLMLKSAALSLPHPRSGKIIEISLF